MKLENLLLVAGSGRNSGKTTIICKLIEQFHGLGITSIKISPHFHTPSGGLVTVSGGEGYEIYEETNLISSKDTSRMLGSGAEKVYYIQTMESAINESFCNTYKNITPGKPVICESPSLINYIEPGVFIIMISPAGSNLKSTENLKRFPHLEYTLEEILEINNLPFIFADGGWKILK
jgi:hypothetical protein